MVHVKSHAKPVAKEKKERASRGLLSDIPGTLMSRYTTDFQPSFVHASIAISSNPWDKLSIDDAQELFDAVFPEVTHEMTFGDVFYSPVRSSSLFAFSILTFFQANQTASIIRNHIKEVGLTAVHRAMDGLAPTARQHRAGKAECHGKEFPFLYQYYEVTDIPDRHTDGGDAMVSCFVFTTRSIPTDLTSLHSVAKAPFCLRSSVRHWQHITTNLAKLSQSPCLDLRLTSNFMLQLALTLFVQLQYVQIQSHFLSVLKLMSGPGATRPANVFHWPIRCHQTEVRSSELGPINGKGG